MNNDNSSSPALNLVIYGMAALTLLFMGAIAAFVLLDVQIPVEGMPDATKTASAETTPAEKPGLGLRLDDVRSLWSLDVGWETVSEKKYPNGEITYTAQILSPAPISYSVGGDPENVDSLLIVTAIDANGSDTAFTLRLAYLAAMASKVTPWSSSEIAAWLDRNVEQSTAGRAIWELYGEKVKLEFGGLAADNQLLLMVWATPVDLPPDVARKSREALSDSMPNLAANR